MTWNKLLHFLSFSYPSDYFYQTINNMWLVARLVSLIVLFLMVRIVLCREHMINTLSEYVCINCVPQKWDVIPRIFNLLFSLNESFKKRYLLFLKHDTGFSFWNNKLRFLSLTYSKNYLGHHFKGEDSCETLSYPGLAEAGIASSLSLSSQETEKKN